MVEYLISIILVCISFLPGVLLGCVLFGSRKDRFQHSIGISFMFNTLISLILLALGLSGWILPILLLVGIISSILLLKLNVKIDLKEKVKKLLNRRNFIVILIYIFTMLAFWSWERVLPGLAGWDRSRLVIYSHFMTEKLRLPPYEIGTPYLHFYQMGFSLAIQPAMFLGSILNISLSKLIIAFVVILFATILYILGKICRKILNSKKWEFGIFFASLFISRFYPNTIAMLLGFYLVYWTVLYLFEMISNKKLAKRYWLILFLIFLTALYYHFISFVFLACLSMSVCIILLKRKEYHKLFNLMFVALLGLLGSVLLLKILYENHLNGILGYFGLYNSSLVDVSELVTKGSSNTVSNFNLSILWSFSKDKVGETLFDFLYFPYMPVLFLLYFKYIFKNGFKYRDYLLYITLVVLYLSLTGIIWFKGRTPYFLLIPFSLAFSLAFTKLSISRLFKRIILFISFLIFAFILSDYKFSFQTNRSYEIRLASGIEESDIASIKALRTYFKDSGVYVSPTREASYWLIDAYSEANVYSCDSFNQPISFKHMCQFINNENYESLKRVYGINGVIFKDKNKHLINPEILEKGDIVEKDNFNLLLL